MELQSLRLSRRKLVDKIMQTFLIGNTTARPLITSLEGERLGTPHQDQTSGAAVETTSADLSVEARKRKRDSPEDSSSSLDLLFLGVGDLRNPLLTLTNIPGNRPVSIYLNDLSPVTIARNVVILQLSKSSTVELVAEVWYDALVSSNAVLALKEALRFLLNDSAQWLKVFDEGTREKCWKQWTLWQKVLDNYEAYQSAMVSARAVAMRDENVGHGRTGVSQLWKETGVSSRSVAAAEAKGLTLNPTLFHCELSDNPTFMFLDTQGPGGAFLELDQLQCGSSEFAEQLIKTVRPLVNTFKTRRSVVFTVHCGDGMDMLRMADGVQLFHAVDTSNLMDYLGIFNLLIATRKVLHDSKDSFVVTEQVLRSSTSIHDMFEEYFPKDSNRGLLLCAYLGFSVSPLETGLKAEKVVRCRWRNVPEANIEIVVSEIQRSLENPVRQRKQSLLGILDGYLTSEAERQALLTFTLSELEMVYLACENFEGAAMVEEIGVMLREIVIKKQEDGPETRDDSTIMLHKSLNSLALTLLSPVALNEAMTSNPRKPIELNYSWPTHTVYTFVSLVHEISGRSNSGRARVQGFWERFYMEDGLAKVPGIRNRRYALTAMRSLVGVKDESTLATSLNQGKAQMLTFQMEPTMDLKKCRGGVFEPALAAILIKDNTTLEMLNKFNWKFRQSASSSFQYVYFKCNSKRVQLFDNVAFDMETNQLTLPLPPMTKLNFKFLALMDIQRYALITKPIELHAREEAKEDHSATG